MHHVWLQVSAASEANSIWSARGGPKAKGKAARKGRKGGGEECAAPARLTELAAAAAGGGGRAEPAERPALLAPGADAARWCPFHNFLTRPHQAFHLLSQEEA